MLIWSSEYVELWRSTWPATAPHLRVGRLQPIDRNSPGRASSSELAYDGSERRVREIEKENGVDQSDLDVLGCRREIFEERAASGTTLTRRAFPHPGTLPCGRRASHGDDIEQRGEPGEIGGIARIERQPSGQGGGGNEESVARRPRAFRPLATTAAYTRPYARATLPSTGNGSNVASVRCSRS